jgi:hypothetical protein
LEVTEGRRFQESDSGTVQEPTLTNETFQRELASIGEFFGEIVQRMGSRWTVADSVHLSSAGWQALGVLHHDMNHRGLTLTPLEKRHVYEAISNLDWSRENPLWIDTVKIGQWVITKEGQKVISIRGAGRTTAQDLIDYLHKVSGLDSKLDILHKPDPAVAAAV